MFWTILQRKILWELIKVFGLTLLAVTGILVFFGLIKEAPGRGLTPFQILEFIPFFVPETLPYIIPSSLLFAACAVYGRLSRDNEILALQAGGINLLVIVWPAALLGVVMSAATMALYCQVIPYTRYVSHFSLVRGAEELAYAELRNTGRISLPSVPYIIYVRAVRMWTLVDPIIKRRDAKGCYDLIVYARQGELRMDLLRRRILIRMGDGEILKGDGATVHFNEKILDIELPPTFGLHRPDNPSDMTWQQLLQRRREATTEDENQTARIAAARSGRGGPELAATVAADLPVLEEKCRRVHHDVCRSNIELQKRPALSLACLCFVLVGCPVGIRSHQGDYLGVFVICFLPVIAIYYPLLLCGISLASGGYLPPSVAVWVANVAVGLVALELFRRLMKN